MQMAGILSIWAHIRTVGLEYWEYPSNTGIEKTLTNLRDLTNLRTFLSFLRSGHRSHGNMPQKVVLLFFGKKPSNFDVFLRSRRKIRGSTAEVFLESHATFHFFLLFELCLVMRVPSDVNAMLEGSTHPGWKIGC